MKKGQRKFKKICDFDRLIFFQFFRFFLLTTFETFVILLLSNNKTKE